MHYRIARPAQRDLEEIYIYWAERTNPDVAGRILDSLIDRFWLLGEHPDAGRKLDDIAPGVRCFPAGKYLIYYRRFGRGTDILHVFHGARDQTKIFDEKEDIP